MADQKISALTEVTAPSASDMMAIVNAATTKKVQAQNVVKAVPAIWARVFHNANQSITNATPTALAFNSERADTDTIHDTVTNNSRLTCTTAGVYLISANVEWAANATGYREMYIQLGGATRIADSVIQAVTGGTVTRQIITTIYALTASQYVELIVNHAAGTAINITANANHSPEFMMVRLGA